MVYHGIPHFQTEPCEGIVQFWAGSRNYEDHGTLHFSGKVQIKYHGSCMQAGKKKTIPTLSELVVSGISSVAWLVSYPNKKVDLGSQPLPSLFSHRDQSQ